MQRVLCFAVLSLLVTGCGDNPMPTAVADSTLQFSGAPTVTTAPFFATAHCMADIGFNIHFGGQRALMAHTTTDRRGRTHQTMHFRVQDFVGWQTELANPPATIRNSAPDYDVQGGAEMFAIHRDAAGDITVRIHQGNLVFVDTETGERVIAHHTIREVPGRAPANYWSCRMTG